MLTSVDVQLDRERFGTQNPVVVQGVFGVTGQCVGGFDDGGCSGYACALQKAAAREGDFVGHRSLSDCWLACRLWIHLERWVGVSKRHKTIPLLYIRQAHCRHWGACAVKGERVGIGLNRRGKRGWLHRNERKSWLAVWPQ